MNTNEVKVLHLLMLADVMDRPLSRLSFHRHRRSTCYARKIERGMQRIDIVYTRSRKSDDASICHIQPIVLVELLAVNAIALEMVGSNESLLGTPKDVTLAIPLGFLGPERTFKSWRPLDDEDYRSQVAELAQYVEQYAVPFLNEYDDPKALVSGYANHDDRLVMALQPLAMRAIAAAVYCSQYDRARLFLETAFQSAGAARRYQCVFEYLDKSQRS